MPIVMGSWASQIWTLNLNSVNPQSQTQTPKFQLLQRQDRKPQPSQRQESAMPTETKAESGASERKSGTSLNLSNSGNCTRGKTVAIVKGLATSTNLDPRPQSQTPNPATQNQTQIQTPTSAEPRPPRGRELTLQTAPEASTQSPNRTRGKQVNPKPRQRQNRPDREGDRHLHKSGSAVPDLDPEPQTLNHKP